MQAVETLYKSNPEYFHYPHMRYALNQNNPKILYRVFPEARESKIFDSFTTKSLAEIRRNLLTPKYPVLFISYLCQQRIDTKTFSKKEEKHYLKILDILDGQTLTDKENKIINKLTQSVCFWVELMKLEPYVTQREIAIPPI